MTLTRYLPSQNHDIPDDVAPRLSREEFVAVFEQAIELEPQYGEIQVARVEHLGYKVLILGGLKTTPATSYFFTQ